jgi:hypothetical protein
MMKIVETADSFPYDAVIDLVRACRADDQIARIGQSTPHRRTLVRRHVTEVSERYGIDPKQLSHVTALMMDNKDVSAAFTG